MGRKLYIGNLPYSVTEDTLRGEFSKLGTVDSVKIITDRDTGRSKGFAFIEMSTDEEAEEAISSLNGVELDNRKMTVTEAKPQAPRESRGGGFGGGRDSRGGGNSGGGGGRSRW